jgi:hypothetical protein
MAKPEERYKNPEEYENFKNVIKYQISELKKTLDSIVF